MITLKQMEAFQWIARTRSVASAAQCLGTTESTISKRLQELERVMGVILFERTHRSMRLTATGHKLLPLVEVMLGTKVQIEALAAKRERPEQRFRFGLTELIALTWLPRLVDLTREHYPDLILEPEVGLTTELSAKMQAGSISLMITPHVVATPGLTEVPLPPSQAAWLCSPDLKGLNEPVPADQLSHFPIILQPEQSALHQLIVKWFADNGTQLRRKMTCNSLLALSELAAGGFGIAPLPVAYFRPQLEAGRLRVLQTLPPLPPLPYAVYFCPDENLPISKELAGLAVRAANHFEYRRAQMV